MSVRQKVGSSQTAQTCQCRCVLQHEEMASVLAYNSEGLLPEAEVSKEAQAIP